MRKTRLFKPSLFITALVLSTLTAKAQLVGSGLYLGAGLQYNSGEVDYTGNTVFSAGIENTATQTADISANGFSGVALLGYGFPFCNQFYLGAELQGAINANQEGSANATAFFSDETEVVNLSAKTKFLNNYGLFIRPGYYLNQNILLFLRGGYINGEFETTIGAGQLNGSSQVTQDKRAGGYLLGFGSEMHIAKGWGFRAEYDYMHYQTINVNDAITFPTPASQEFSSITANTAGKFSPQANVLSLILTYTFGFKERQP